MEFKKSLMALLIGSSVALAACGGGDDNAGKDNDGGKETASADGEQVYKQSCMSCHGEKLEGQVGPALDKIGSKYSKDEILNIVENGKGQMPPNVVKGDDAEAVAEWLATKK
ncbi:cytochrome c551 [Bacillus badius]|uniref:Cytochrome c551 n=1 Tax=Bacillus badius TaxID=1455 RepID=A0ABR5AX51_BACBA|nr:cytochrome c [Bacillus badius]KIL76251.1 cytochrome c551 [Bacillus badius]KIL79185.1 cytochrome c551 [Bacillus badius]KZO00207.1 cytochrome C551 [Bacillus badius]KZR59909.1 cytochrome C551 [Bacillus badius]MED0668241.1 cytochrome c [Bacillus badius]